jgi:hypothetical protein
LVAAIYGFLGPALESVRRNLVEQHRQHKATEEAKRLRKEASRIEEILNRDFNAFRHRLQKMKAAAAKAGIDAGDAVTLAPAEIDGEDNFLFGGDVPARVTSEHGEEGIPNPTDDPRPLPPRPQPRRLNPIVEPDENGPEHGHHSSPSSESKPTRRGGFNVEFANHGESEARAEYKRDSRTIFINLDHPQIAASLKGRSIEDAVFRRLAYEVAFCEYSMAVAQELDRHGDFLDPLDAIVFVRERIHAIARSAAALYEDD